MQRWYILRRKREGHGLQIEGVQRVTELMVSQILATETVKEKGEKRKGGKLVHGDKLEEYQSRGD